MFLGGGAKIGKMVTMHTKSTVLPCKTVGDNCVVGVASTVMRNFKSNCSLLEHRLKFLIYNISVSVKYENYPFLSGR